jgi:hypothetical protein
VVRTAALEASARPAPLPLLPPPVLCWACTIASAGGAAPGPERCLLAAGCGACSRYRYPAGFGTFLCWVWMT